jgi:hypothetical protein
MKRRRDVILKILQGLEKCEWPWNDPLRQDRLHAEPTTRSKRERIPDSAASARRPADAGRARRLTNRRSQADRTSGETQKSDSCGGHLAACGPPEERGVKAAGDRERSRSKSTRSGAGACRTAHTGSTQGQVGAKAWRTTQRPYATRGWPGRHAEPRGGSAETAVRHASEGTKPRDGPQVQKRRPYATRGVLTKARAPRPRTWR